MTSEFKKLRDDFNENGFCVFRNEKLISDILTVRSMFHDEFLSKFTDDPVRNRQIVKLITDTQLMRSFWCRIEVQELLRSVCSLTLPLYCGPSVSHYTALDRTGNGFGLPFHQDWPSMAGSVNSVILWTNLVDSSASTHGIEIAKGCHRAGVFEGISTEHGLEIKEESLDSNSLVIPSIAAGEVLVMSSFVPHRTFVNQDYSGWKLSLSQRFDDFACSNWDRHDFKSAYYTSVDRLLFKSIDLK